jgi:membrane protein DedA with SNARE-associated domain
VQFFYTSPHVHPRGGHGVFVDCFFVLLYSLEMRKRNYIEFIFILALLLSWIVLLYFFPPEVILSFIGVEGGYLLVFLTAILGVSAFASSPFYGTFITIASTGEFNIFLLLLVSVPALTLGDSIFFLIGHKGHFVADNFFEKKLTSFSKWIESKPKLLVPLFAYFYTAFTPLPQDALMATLGLGRANFKKVFIAVLLGNATFLSIVYLFSKFVFPNFF